ncbi:hypothetical protein [Ottowia thiooxydans]|uniref:hypothetical protein n=1 Tax=Ottowia thiooxydans TaxID=219182 RepID=UPI000412EC6F|nr:hypothetical protein [Ottowia thiooxydans]
MAGEIVNQNTGGGPPTVQTTPFTHNVRAEGTASATTHTRQGREWSVSDGRAKANLLKEKNESIASSFRPEHFPYAKDTSGLAKKDRSFQDAKALSTQPKTSPSIWMNGFESAKALEEAKTVLDRLDSMMREADFLEERGEQRPANMDADALLKEKKESRVSSLSSEHFPSAEDTSGLAKKDRSFQDAKALSTQPKISPSVWMNGIESAKALEAAKKVLDGLDSMMREADFLEERGEQGPPIVGNGRARGETLSWGEEAKQVFAKFLSSIVSGLESVGRFIADVPSRLARMWGAAPTGKAAVEKAIVKEHSLPDSDLGGGDRRKAAVEEAFANNLRLRESEVGKDDRMPARKEGSARYICTGMAKDALRSPVFIGGQQFKLPSGPVGETKDQLDKRHDDFLEEVAEALLAQCGGDTALCMKVSNFAYQIMLSFPLTQIREGNVVANENSNLNILDIIGKRDHGISMKRQTENSMRLDYYLTYENISHVTRTVGQKTELVEVNPSSSFHCDYAMVVNSEPEPEPESELESDILMSAKPYPRKPYSDDQSAVHYKFNIDF